MRPWPTPLAHVAASVAAAMLGACVLLTPLDGFSDGSALAETGAEPPPGVPEGGSSGSVVDAPSDAQSEAGPTRSSLYREAVLADGPLGYWRFEEVSGTVARDETGRYDGELRNAPRLQAPGIFGSPGAIELPADQNAHVRVEAPVFRFAGTQAHTVEMWAKPGKFANFQWLGGTEVGARAGWSLLAFGTAEVHYEVWGAADGGTPTSLRVLTLEPKKLVLGQFPHLVVSYSADEMAGYIDGLLVATGVDGSSMPDTGSLIWGCRGESAVNVASCLDGWVLDEIAVYDRVLSPARIAAHYTAGK